MITFPTVDCTHPTSEKAQNESVCESTVQINPTELQIHKSRPFCEFALHSRIKEHSTETSLTKY